MHGALLHCRAGFEAECAAEIQSQAQAQGIAGYCKAKPASAYVMFVTHSADAAQQLHRNVEFERLIFARQWFQCLALCNNLDTRDRISGLLAALGPQPTPCGELFLETVDTNTGKTLQPLCRSLHRPLTAALCEQAILVPQLAGQAPRLHICFLSTQAAYLGLAEPHNSSAYPMGIPRLRFPRAAPSRSALKLEEAFVSFFSAEQRQRLLRPGMTAVDLGAAPGGWTWQLVARGLHVTAVDNAALAPALLASDQVDHRRHDGFSFRPAPSVDWMLCDMVEQPHRIAKLAGHWLASGLCRHALFNLKLPMKKRYQTVQSCLAELQLSLQSRGQDDRILCKQLYHDREEVTVYAGPG